MTTLSPDQRNYLYILEAERVGIHKSILAALYLAQEQPSLEDGETGLGISPAHRISLDQVNTFAGQIQYGANTIRSLTDSLIKKGWQGVDLWDANRGHLYQEVYRSDSRRLRAASDRDSSSSLGTLSGRSVVASVSGRFNDGFQV